VPPRRSDRLRVEPARLQKEQRRRGPQAPHHARARAHAGRRDARGLGRRGSPTRTRSGSHRRTRTKRRTAASERKRTRTRPGRHCSAWQGTFFVVESLDTVP
jgi:hypothetical protein